MKNYFQLSVFLSGITTLLCSCGSNGNDPGNSDSRDSSMTIKIPSGDSSVKTKNNTNDNTTTYDPNVSLWTTNSDLIKGNIRVVMNVDGVKSSAETGKITIRPKTDLSAIQITSQQGDLDLRSGWHGMGNYDKAPTEWIDISEGTPIRYSTDANAPGILQITQWADGKVAGTFTATVIENNAIQIPRKKVLTGQFSYIPDKVN